MCGTDPGAPPRPTQLVVFVDSASHLSVAGRNTMKRVKGQGRFAKIRHISDSYLKWPSGESRVRFISKSRTLP